MVNKAVEALNVVGEVTVTCNPPAPADMQARQRTPSPRSARETFAAQVRFQLQDISRVSQISSNRKFVVTDASGAAPPTPTQMASPDVHRCTGAYVCNVQRGATIVTALKYKAKTDPSLSHGPPRTVAAPPVPPALTARPRSAVHWLRALGAGGFHRGHACRLLGARRRRVRARRPPAPATDDGAPQTRH